MTRADQRTMTLAELVDAWRSGLLNGRVKCRRAGSLEWIPLREIPEVREQLEARSPSTVPPSAPKALPLPANAVAPKPPTRRSIRPDTVIRSLDPGSPDGPPGDIGEALRQYLQTPRASSPPQLSRVDDPFDDSRLSQMEHELECEVEAWSREGDSALGGSPSIPPTVPSPSPARFANLPSPNVEAFADTPRRAPANKPAVDQIADTPRVDSSLLASKMDSSEAVSPDPPVAAVHGSLHPIAMSQPPEARSRTPRWVVAISLAAAAAGLVAVARSMIRVSPDLVTEDVSVLDGPGLRAAIVGRGSASAASHLVPIVVPVDLPKTGDQVTLSPSVPEADAPDEERETPEAPVKARARVPPPGRSAASHEGAASRRVAPSDTASTAAAEPSLTQDPLAPFDPMQGMAALNRSAAGAAACAQPGGVSGTGSARVTFDPATGTVASAVVEEPFANDPVGACVVGRFMSAKVDPFSGAAVSATVQFRIP